MSLRCSGGHPVEVGEVVVGRGQLVAGEVLDGPVDEAGHLGPGHVEGRAVLGRRTAARPAGNDAGCSQSVDGRSVDAVVRGVGEPVVAVVGRERLEGVVDVERLGLVDHSSDERGHLVPAHLEARAVAAVGLALGDLRRGEAADLGGERVAARHVRERVRRRDLGAERRRAAGRRDLRGLCTDRRHARQEGEAGCCRHGRCPHAPADARAHRARGLGHVVLLRPPHTRDCPRGVSTHTGPSPAEGAEAR